MLLIISTDRSASTCPPSGPAIAGDVALTAALDRPFRRQVPANRRSTGHEGLQGLAPPLHLHAVVEEQLKRIDDRYVADPQGVDFHGKRRFLVLLATVDDFLVPQLPPRGIPSWRGRRSQRAAAASFSVTLRTGSVLDLVHASTGARVVADKPADIVDRRRSAGHLLGIRQPRSFNIRCSAALQYIGAATGRPRQ